jgi:hydantoinase/carbamoylase family amidase
VTKDAVQRRSWTFYEAIKLDTLLILNPNGVKCMGLQKTNGLKQIGESGKDLVNAERLWSDLQELGKIGFVEGRGVTRLALSDADIAAKEWLIIRMKEAGLEVHMDAATNVIGKLKSARQSNTKIVAVGSHLDTVPQGGIFDGALGVLAGLECARVLQENKVTLPWDLEIINFSDEEAFHNNGTIGSRAMMGTLSRNEIYRSKEKGIPTFAEDMKRLGKDPDRIGEAIRDPQIFRACLELHIEQGNLLESRGIDIGAVTGIAGIYRYIVEILGKTGHAGTTPMSLRDDALVKAAPIFTLLPQWVRARNPEMVGTIGQIAVEPGAINVVPGKCVFNVELRSIKREDITAICHLLTEWVGTQKGSSIKTIYEKESAELSKSIIDAVARAAEIEGLSAIRMISGAGHDCQVFAPYVPTGLIFVPSRGGKSHCPEEWTDAHQAANGCRVLLRTILELAGQDSTP